MLRLVSSRSLLEVWTNGRKKWLPTSNSSLGIPWAISGNPLTALWWPVTAWYRSYPLYWAAPMKLRIYTPARPLRDCVREAISRGNLARQIANVADGTPIKYKVIE